jgi:serine/threonine protein phosphatase PrpC
VCALVTPSHILCASAGDSRCILGSGGKCIALSEDHRPDDLKERMRIERAGHFVAMHRVDGELAMSRALGDFQYKTRPLFPRSEQAVTCVPDIEVHERSTADEVLVLASDGVWDVLSNRDAVTFLSEFLIKHDSHLTMRQAAGALVELSLRQGSTDNVSSVVVRLGKLRGERVASGDSNTTNTNNRGSSSASVKKRKRA